MKKFLLAGLFILAANILFASTGNNSSNSGTCISGTVVDANTRKPLAEVTVTAVNGNRTETVTTNAQGQFKIQSLAQGTYTIRLTREDYKNEKKEVVLKPENNVKITVEMVAEELENNSHRSWWDKFDLYL